MIYLLNTFDLDLIDWEDGQYLSMELFRTGEDKVRGWIKNERTKTIIDKQEVVNLFNITDKVQMAKVDRILLKKHDKVIIWTPEGNYRVFRINGPFD